MLKISEGKQTKQTTMLRLEGRLVGPWVAELEQICKPLLSNVNRLELELAEVAFVDESGVTLLTRLKDRGATLLNAAPFVEQQLRIAELEAELKNAR